MIQGVRSFAGYDWFLTRMEAGSSLVAGIIFDLRGSCRIHPLLTAAYSYIVPPACS